MYLIFSLLFFTISVYASYCFTVLLSALLLFLCEAQFVPYILLYYCCSINSFTSLPCVSSPLFCYHPTTLSRFQRSALGVQNTVFTRTNTKSISTQRKTEHRQFGRSANDAGLCPATQFSDYRAETTKEKKCPLAVSNPLEMLSNAVTTIHTSFRTRPHDILNSNICFTGANVNTHLIVKSGICVFSVFSGCRSQKVRQKMYKVMYLKCLGLGLFRVC